jgi:large subunit ribosomal protein L21
MYAIVSIAGQQFKVEKGKKVFVHRLPGEIGDDVNLDKVLLISHDDKVNVGAPYVPNAVVLAQIVSHLRGDKVLVFKKKRRKTYQKLNGHRQDFTEILIEEISETGVPAKTEKKKAVAPKVEKTEVASADVKESAKPAPKAAAKKAAAKTTTEAKAKKAPVKKEAAPKKPAAKAAKKPE